MTNTLNERYGGKSKRYAERARASGTSKRYLLLIGALSLVGVAIAAWFTFTNPQSFVQTQVIAFQPLNNHQLQMQFQVSMPPQQTAVCGIEALSAQKAVVGYREIEVGQSTRHERVFDELIETIEPAVTGLISYCFTE